MRSEITRLHDKLKTIFIYVTHDQAETMTMGTKIVVLKDGVIQQAGSPETIFLNPTNHFVAGFIGTPQINFMEATISKKEDGYYLALSSGKAMKLPAERMKNFDEAYLDKKVTMGIRPTQFPLKGI